MKKIKNQLIFFMFVGSIRLTIFNNAYDTAILASLMFVIASLAQLDKAISSPLVNLIVQGIASCLAMTRCLNRAISQK